MSRKKIEIAIITAYGFARLGGYTGTKEEFEAGLAASAQYATNAAASATAAAGSATAAAGSATSAAESATATAADRTAVAEMVTAAQAAQAAAEAAAQALQAIGLYRDTDGDLCETEEEDE